MGHQSSFASQSIATETSPSATMPSTTTVILAASALVALATALPAHPPTYKSPGMPYEFAYSVNAENYGPQFGQTESSDGHVVEGSYVVQLPDGRKQTVTYEADHEGGYNAVVSYYGEAQYPPKSDIPPFVVKPAAYGPTPAPTYQ